MPMQRLKKTIDPRFSIEWLIEQAVKFAPWVLGYTGAGGAMTWLVAWSEDLKAWQIVLVFLGTISALWIFVAIIRILHYKAREHLARAKIISSAADGGGIIDPLETIFSKRTIRLSDFDIPFSPVHKGKQFYECNFIGPGTIIFLDHIALHAFDPLECTFMTLDEPISFQSGIGFHTCQFQNCKFWRVTFIFHTSFGSKIEDAAHKRGQRFKFVPGKLGVVDAIN